MIEMANVIHDMIENLPNEDDPFAKWVDICSLMSTYNTILGAKHWKIIMSVEAIANHIKSYEPKLYDQIQRAILNKQTDPIEDYERAMSII